MNPGYPIPSRQKSTDTVTTTTITETLHDTIITIQPDSSMIQALVECDSTGQAYLRQIRQLTDKRQTLICRTLATRQ